MQCAWEKASLGSHGGVPRTAGESNDLISLRGLEEAVI